jgi:TonB family protein
MTGRGSDSAPIRRGGLPEHATRLAGKRGIVQVSEWRALSFALLAHLVLFFLLFFGVSWKTTDRCKNGVPTPLSYFERMLNDVREVFGWPPKLPPECMVRVELWSPPAARNPTLTPRPALPPVPVEPSAPTQQRKPVAALEPIVQAAKTEPVKVAPAQRLPAPAAEPKPIVKPDLAIARAKAEREKAERDKAERDRAARDKAERVKTEREKVERERAERDKAERVKTEREKVERERAEREKVERDRAEREKAERENPVKIKEWETKVKTFIRLNTSMPQSEALQTNPEVLFQINLNADCTVTSVQKIKPSPSPAWDRAAEAAISKTGKFPIFPGGSCPPRVDLSHRPKD